MPGLLRAFGGSAARLRPGTVRDERERSGAKVVTSSHPGGCHRRNVEWPPCTRNVAPERCSETCNESCREPSDERARRRTLESPHRL